MRVKGESCGFFFINKYVDQRWLIFLKIKKRYKFLMNGWNKFSPTYFVPHLTSYFINK